MRHKKGMVYLVGAGPGDPELITVKATRLLKTAQAVVYDRLANPRILQYIPEDAELHYVGKAASRHTLTQDKINMLLVRLAKKGKMVVRLKGGDPFVFGRGGEEILALVKYKIPFEVVPGVTSAVAVPAYAGIPVTHRGMTSGFAVFTGQEDPEKADSSIAWDKISTGIGTLVFLMGVENLASIVKTLMKYGRPESTPCCLIQWGTLPYQKTVAGTLATIIDEVRRRGITPPAILVVGDVVSLRNKLNWFEKQPLFHKKVLVTLPAEDNSRLSETLAGYGADCTALPLISIRRMDDYKQLDGAIRRIGDFHWLIFTSQNGVRFFKERLAASHMDIRCLRGVKIASIGPKTKEAVEALGLRNDVQPKSYTQEGLVAALKSAGVKGANILIVRAREARDVLPDGLAALGARVKVIAAYRAQLRAEKVKGAGYLNDFDMITFTSSSCVQGFFKAFSRKQIFSKKNKFEVASIGPITSQTCRKCGLKVSVEAKKFTLDGLTAAILKTVTAKSRHAVIASQHSVSAKSRRSVIAKNRRLVIARS
ncbi:MAG: uroporphyrinogen-III C-methyltransferase [Candidatus Omnitrophota bacterium]